VLERVFEPYVTTKPRGSGLGLAIVRRTIDEHGGEIDVSNPSDGGAEVRIWLPRG
jgi:nitrogen fixation/metabolism regulation signal transduction histidine kinase